MKVDSVFGQALRTIAARYLAAENSPDHAIGVSDVQLRFDLFFAFQSRRGEIEQHLVIERVLQAMVLRDLAVASHFRPDLWLVEYRRVIQSFGFQLFYGAPHLDPIRAPDHFIDRAKAQLRHMLAHFLRNKAHKVNHVSRITGKFCAQFWILGCDADGTSIEMANPHHDAAESY